MRSKKLCVIMCVNAILVNAQAVWDLHSTNKIQMPATFQPSPDRQCSVCAGEGYKLKSINSMPSQMSASVSPLANAVTAQAWWNTPQKQVSAMVGVAAKCCPIASGCLIQLSCPHGTQKTHSETLIIIPTAPLKHWCSAPNG